MIRFACSSCNAAMSVPEAMAGQKGACPKCGQRVQVPQPAAQRASGRGSQPEVADPEGVDRGFIGWSACAVVMLGLVFFWMGFAGFYGTASFAITIVFLTIGALAATAGGIVSWRTPQGKGL